MAYQRKYPSTEEHKFLNCQGKIHIIMIVINDIENLTDSVPSILQVVATKMMFSLR